MTHRLRLMMAAPLLCACSGVTSLETAIPRGTATFDQRLVGDWELMEGPTLEARVVVTREGAAEYLVRWMNLHGDSTVLAGRLGALGARRWLLEFSPVADTNRYTHEITGRDSTRLAAPSRPLMLPIHMLAVVESADSGLLFSLFNYDSLKAQLQSGRLRAPYAIRDDAFFSTVLLTEPDAGALNASLREFANRRGTLIPVPRVGHRLAIPAWR